MGSRRWTENARRRVKEAVRLFGIRVECMRCGWQGRHPHETEQPTGLPPEAEHRLRHARCPKCSAVWLRSRAWCERYPDLALAERRSAAR